MATRHGGRRPGAGRPPGSRNRATLAREADGRTLTELAREKTAFAVGVLESVAADADAPASARISAAKALLDRAWGRPSQRVEIDDGSPGEGEGGAAPLVWPGDPDFVEPPAA